MSFCAFCKMVSISTCCLPRHPVRSYLYFVYSLSFYPGQFQQQWSDCCSHASERALIKHSRVSELVRQFKPHKSYRKCFKIIIICTYTMTQLHTIDFHRTGGTVRKMRWHLALWWQIATSWMPLRLLLPFIEWGNMTRRVESCCKSIGLTQRSSWLQ